MAPLHTRVPLEAEHPDSDYPFIVPVATLQSSLDIASDSNSRNHINIAVSSILPAVYGMPHLLGWNTVFPTRTEQVLWRTAALAVTVSGCATGVFTLPIVYSSLRLNYWIDLSFAIGKTALFVALIPYVVASGYLLVESFRQLFALPPGAFQLASWANMIPHFS